jgi:hypothetical protein
VAWLLGLGAFESACLSPALVLDWVSPLASLLVFVEFDVVELPPLVACEGLPQSLWATFDTASPWASPVVDLSWAAADTHAPWLVALLAAGAAVVLDVLTLVAVPDFW